MHSLQNHLQRNLKSMRKNTAASSLELQCSFHTHTCVSLLSQIICTMVSLPLSLSLCTLGREDVLKRGRCFCWLSFRLRSYCYFCFFVFLFCFLFRLVLFCFDFTRPVSFVCPKIVRLQTHTYTEICESTRRSCFTCASKIAEKN